MKSKHIEALISYRMERSRESIRAAEIMLENEMLTISMNRVYYSMFYAVQALLVLHNCFRFDQLTLKGEPLNLEPLYLPHHCISV